MHSAPASPFSFTQCQGLLLHISVSPSLWRSWTSFCLPRSGAAGRPIAAFHTEPLPSLTTVTRQHGLCSSTYLSVSHQHVLGSSPYLSVSRQHGLGSSPYLSVSRQHGLGSSPYLSASRQHCLGSSNDCNDVSGQCGHHRGEAKVVDPLFQVWQQCCIVAGSI